MGLPQRRAHTPALPSEQPHRRTASPQLEASALIAFIAAQRIVKGGTASRLLFNGAADNYQALLRRFDHESQDGLLDRSRRAELSALQDALQEALYLFASTAMTLVDQSRAFVNQVAIPGYEERIATFRVDPQHRFIQELRVDFIHVSMHRPEWEINHVFGADGGRTSRFLLPIKLLRRLNEYSAPARAYVMTHPKGIDLGAMIDQYRIKVNDLHDWLHAGIDRECGKEIGDYLRVLRLIEGIAARSA